MNAPTTALELAPVESPRVDAQSSQPLTVIEHAVRSGATPDQLERLLDLQVRADNHKLELMREQRRMAEEDRQRAAERAFDAAMVKFRGHNVIVPKTKEVVQVARNGGPGPRFMQSEFDVVCRMLSPALHDSGLSFRHDMKFGSKKWASEGVESDIPWVTVTCYLTHTDGHTESLTLEGPADSSGAKNPLQEMQSTASYLKRQGLLAITGTATGGEDDESALRRRAGRQGNGGGGGEEDGPSPLEALRTAGRDKALEGMKALTDWWGSLTARQRTDLSPDFPGFRRAAQAADKQGAPT